MLLYAPSSSSPAAVCRYSAVIAPVTNYIMEVLPEGTRDTKPMELAYEDLEKLSGEEIMRICEWLTDKVGLCDGPQRCSQDALVLHVAMPAITNTV